jgi:7-carboxy-7-deazaguanine synthase
MAANNLFEINKCLYTDGFLIFCYWFRICHLDRSTQYMNLRVCEIFKSIQGESSYAGLPFAIVRLTGCNLRCSYCDTPYAWDEGAEMDLNEVAQRIMSLKTKHVLLTGGEPLLQSGSIELAAGLSESGYEVLVETNGSLDISALPNDVVAVVDIKCPASGQSHMMNWDNLNRLRPRDEVKFVVTDRYDYDWAREICQKKLIGSCKEILMAPVFGSLAAREIAEWILSDNLEVRLQLQLHKYIWPEEMRGV